MNIRLINEKFFEEHVDILREIYFKFLGYCTIIIFFRLKLGNQALSKYEVGPCENECILFKSYNVHLTDNGARGN